MTADWVQGPGGVAIAGDGWGNVYTVRYDYNPAGDIQLIKHNSSGIQQWQVSYDQTNTTLWEQATWASCDADGNVIICGTLKSGYSNPVTAASILMKFNPAGTLLWRVVFDNSFDGSSTKRCLVDGSGNIYVLGLGMSPCGLVSRVKAFNSNGSERWNWFDNEGIGAAQHFKLTPDQALLIYCRGITGSINGYAKLDLSGNKLWSLTGIYSVPTGDLAGDSNGYTYIVHGDSQPNGTVLRKLDPAGVTLWSVTHPFAGFRVEVGSDDQAIACGFSNANTGGAAFVKFNPSGGVVWENLNADGIQNLLLHSQLLLDERNNAYLAAGVLTHMAVCKVNHDGSNGWLYLGSDGSTASSIALGPKGRVYMTGGNTTQLSQPHEPLLAKLEMKRTHGNPTIVVTGEIGRAYRVEVSDDCVTWKPFVTALLASYKQVCVDSNSANKPKRFYRAVLED
ncbi:MAG: hypothetical protein H8M99_10980 [Gloeobacteraceae cyanobacterium ES-bin-144]|nr:hypothetical protein [Verrucomicrobiales bacterium]